MPNSPYKTKKYHRNGILFQKLWEKNCSSDREKLLKFKAEGREFAKVLRSLEQFFSQSRSEQFLKQNAI